jgi:hypothetical protein
MVKPINIPWTTVQGKWDLSGVAIDCSLLGWHSMLLGNLFLIIVPPTSRVKMTVLQSFEMQGSTFNTVSHPRRHESSTPWKVPNFTLSNLWTGCPKNLSVLSCCLVCSLTHCYGNTQANANPRLQQKPTVCTWYKPLLCKILRWVCFLRDINSNSLRFSKWCCWKFNSLS